MMTTYTDKPKNQLPRAKLWVNEFNFGKRDIQKDVNNKYCSLSIPQLMREAIRHPGVRFSQFHEENGYEFEHYAIFDAATNTVTTDEFRCPRYFNHHVGDTCSMCGLKD